MKIIFLKKAILPIITLFSILVFSGCSDAIDSIKEQISGEDNTSASSGPVRDNTPKVLTPSADGTNAFNGTASVVDVSNINNGYVMVKYTGTKEKIKVQIRYEGGEPYTYDLTTSGEYEVFPLTTGDGNYTLTVNENITGTQYAVVDTATFTVQLNDQTTPFLYPNQYVNFTAQSQIVNLGSELAQNAYSDLEVVSNIYEYVTANISYDYDLASTVETFYLPDVDSTLTTKKGICFDYAALMTSMLRSQGIPTQLVIGYAGTAYHAWISVYTPETGWIDNVIQFEGDKWEILDPTFASTGGSNPDLASYIGDGQNYNALFFY